MENEQKENSQEDEPQNKDQRERENKEKNQENVDFLRYLQEVEKFPLEMESLRTSIQSNKSTVRLADESISHFAESKSDNRITLLTTLGVSVFTLLILLVQTFSTNQTKLTEPIKIDSEQLQQIFNSEEKEINDLISTQERNNLILSSQIDSLKSELQKLNKAIVPIKKEKHQQ